MIKVCVHGLRGGVGASSLTAGLAAALHQLEQRVLVIDLCPSNSLGLHFNLPFDDTSGWTTAAAQGQHWQQHRWEVEPGLHVLPYGFNANASAAAALPDWPEQLAAVKQHYDWVLFDHPAQVHPVPLTLDSDLNFKVVQPDIRCHLSLQHYHLPGNLFLINNYDPTSQLQNDLHVLWTHQYTKQMVPVIIHRDEAVPEALAFKLPVGLYAPGSQAADALNSLAVWCLSRRGQ